MTNFDLNGIISILQIKQQKNGHLKFKFSMKGYCEKLNKVEFSMDKFLETGLKKDSMESKKTLDDKTVKLTEATNYLIQLFFKSGQRYSCTRTKIGKLLSIVAFTFAREGIRIFNEAVCKYENCGTAINELKAFVERDVYIFSSYDDNLDIKVDESLIQDNDNCIPDRYKEIGSLDKTVQDRIYDVFINFGAYSPSDLGAGLCELIKLKDIIINDVEIDLLKIENLNPNEISTPDWENQKIFLIMKYILNFHQ